MKSLRRAATWLTSALVAAMSVGGASPVASAHPLSEIEYPMPAVKEKTFMDGRVKLRAERLTKDTEGCSVSNGVETVAWTPEKGGDAPNDGRFCFTSPGNYRPMNEVPITTVDYKIDWSVDASDGPVAVPFSWDVVNYTEYTDKIDLFCSSDPMGRWKVSDKKHNSCTLTFEGGATYGGRWDFKSYSVHSAGITTYSVGIGDELLTMAHSVVRAPQYIPYLKPDSFRWVTYSDGSIYGEWTIDEGEYRDRVLGYRDVAFYKNWFYIDMTKLPEGSSEEYNRDKRKVITIPYDKLSDKGEQEISINGIGHDGSLFSTSENFGGMLETPGLNKPADEVTPYRSSVSNANFQSHPNGTYMTLKWDKSTYVAPPPPPPPADAEPVMKWSESVARVNADGTADEYKWSQSHLYERGQTYKFRARHAVKVELNNGDPYDKPLARNSTGPAKYRIGGRSEDIKLEEDISISGARFISGSDVTPISVTIERDNGGYNIAIASVPEMVKNGDYLEYDILFTNGSKRILDNNTVQLWGGGRLKNDYNNLVGYGPPEITLNNPSISIYLKRFSGNQRSIVAGNTTRNEYAGVSYDFYRHLELNPSRKPTEEPVEPTVSREEDPQAWEDYYREDMRWKGWQEYEMFGELMPHTFYWLPEEDLIYSLTPEVEIRGVRFTLDACYINPQVRLAGDEQVDKDNYRVSNMKDASITLVERPNWGADGLACTSDDSGHWVYELDARGVADASPEGGAYVTFVADVPGWAKPGKQLKYSHGGGTITYVGELLKDVVLQGGERVIPEGDYEATLTVADSNMIGQTLVTKNKSAAVGDDISWSGVGFNGTKNSGEGVFTYKIDPNGAVLDNFRMEPLGDANAKNTVLEVSNDGTAWTPYVGGAKAPAYARMTVKDFQGGTVNTAKMTMNTTGSPLGAKPSVEALEGSSTASGAEVPAFKAVAIALSQPAHVEEPLLEDNHGLANDALTTPETEGITYSTTHDRATGRWTVTATPQEGYLVDDTSAVSAGYLSNDDGSYTLTGLFSKDDVATLEHPTIKDEGGVANDDVVAPTTSGVIYTLSYDRVTGAWSVTASPQPFFTLQGTDGWADNGDGSFTLSGKLNMDNTVGLEKPLLRDEEGLSNDTITSPQTEGVDYQVSHSVGEADWSVTARAQSGYVIDAVAAEVQGWIDNGDGTFTLRGVFTNLRRVTPEMPILTDERGVDGDSIVAPTTEGVNYTVAHDRVSGAWSITARAQDGYVVDEAAAEVLGYTRGDDGLYTLRGNFNKEGSVVTPPTEGPKPPVTEEPKPPVTEEPKPPVVEPTPEPEPQKDQKAQLGKPTIKDNPGFLLDEVIAPSTLGVAYSLDYNKVTGKWTLTAWVQEGYAVDEAEAKAAGYSRGDSGLWVLSGALDASVVTPPVEPTPEPPVTEEPPTVEPTTPEPEKPDTIQTGEVTAKSAVANALLGGVGFLGGLALAALGVRRRRG